MCLVIVIQLVAVIVVRRPIRIILKAVEFDTTTAQNWSCPYNGLAINSIIPHRMKNDSSNENLFQ